MRREIIVDDLTGRESDKTESIPVTWNGKKYTMDLCPDSALALDALFTGNGPEMLAKALGYVLAAQTAPAKRAKGSHDSPNAEENRAVRAWWATPEGRKATETPEGQPIPNRGRIPAEVSAAYLKSVLGGN